MSDLNKIKERIASLKKKAQDAGASEAEAYTAMQMALKLADKYGVSLEDLEREDHEVHERAVESGENRLSEVDSLCAVTIATFCDCRAFRKTTGRTHYVHFVGLDSDVELALFIRDTVQKAMNFEFAVYKNFVHEGPMTGVRASFMLGMAGRINERLNEFKRQDSEFDKSKNALIVKKGDIIQAYFSDNNISVRNARRSSNVIRNETAYQSGKISGNAVNMGRGVNKSRAMIEK